MTETADGGEKALATALRAALKRSLDSDAERRLSRPARRPVYAAWWQLDDEARISAKDADLQAIREAREGVQRDLLANAPDDLVVWEASDLMQQYGIPERLRQRLEIGLMEAGVRRWEAAERRTLGLEPLVFIDEPGTDDTSIRAETPPQKIVIEETRPLASALVEPFFVRRSTIDGAIHQVMGQERATLRRFFEVCGDRPPASYTRADVSQFLDTLRQLPTTYGKSQRDRDLPLLEIIARADRDGAPRVKDKTIKRHLSALSQFFGYTVDSGHLTVAASQELTAKHRFREGSKAREQRDLWEPDELARLFSSPVWTGCQKAHRSTPGPHVIRDSKFWLPLLALYEGARLEELADLYRRDIGREGSLDFIRITEENGRSLKTDKAERVIPLHPQLVRLGFLDYVAGVAPNADDPLFPDIRPQGNDQKRGPRMTRWFVEYRRKIGLYRESVAMHAFRHTANTRLRNAISGYQQERHVDYLFGHSAGGGESRERYDKGPGLAAVAGTLALLSYPEVEQALTILDH